VAPESKPYKSAEEFLARMDVGELDANFSEELRKLTRDQLEEVAHILYKRVASPYATPAVPKDPTHHR